MQNQLYEALRRTKLIPEEAGWQQLGYSRCGRTDKGVSALGQVCGGSSAVAVDMSVCMLHLRESPSTGAESTCCRRVLSGVAACSCESSKDERRHPCRIPGPSLT